MPGRSSDFDLVTVEQVGPFARSRSLKRPAFELSWTDAGGDHTCRVTGTQTLGSRPGLDVSLTDPAVSSLHAELNARPDGVWVRDLGSRNGTFVEGVLVTQARIPDGGTLRVGSSVLTLRLGATPEAITLWPNDRFGPLLGRSDAMRELFTLLSKVSPVEAPVLIQGETGTGKELVARAIHGSSPRATKPYVVVDCAALPSDLMEAELFGHTKGAFTGALSGRIGALEEADGGTVFLDEVGELPLSLQPKLLRAIETQRVRPLGGNTERQLNVRFLFATHRDLAAMVNAGTFREDLYFRIAVLLIQVPPLRSRPDDLPMLIQHFLPPDTDPTTAAQVVQQLRARPFAGNVRELRNWVQRAVAFGPAQGLAQAPAAMPKPAPQAAPGSAAPAGSADPILPFKQAREEALERFEREYVAGLLERHGGGVAAAAEAAGIDRTYLYRLIQRHKR